MLFRGNIAGFAAGSGYGHRFGEHFHKADRGCFPAHVHHHLELLFITEGEYRMGTLDFEDRFGAGDVFIANSLEQHWGRCPFRPNSTNTYRCLFLYPENLPSGLNIQLDQGIAFVNKVPAEKAKESGLFEYGIRLLDACDSPVDRNSLEMLGYAMLVLHALMSHQRQNGTFRQDKSAFVQQLMAYVEQHYTEDLSLESTARYFGYEKSYFCRKFRRHFNQSFIDYIHLTRIKKFTSHPALNLQTIAYCAQEVGFSNYSYFYQVFKKVLGVSPRTWLMHRATGRPDLFS